MEGVAVVGWLLHTVPALLPSGLYEVVHGEVAAAGAVPEGAPPTAAWLWDGPEKALTYTCTQAPVSAKTHMTKSMKNCSSP